MSFESREISVESGQPLELFVFVIGATTYRYTSDPESVIFNTQSYEPRQIRHGSSEQDSGEAKSQLEITLPTEDDVASRYIGVVPGQVMTVQVTRIHRGEAEGYLFFNGIVTGAAYSKQGAQCSLQCLTREAAFSRGIPRYKYQGLCNHILYDSNCKVDKELYRYDGTVSNVDGRVITVTGITGEGAQWAVGGYIRFGDDYRLVLEQSGDDLTMLIEFAEEVDGEDVIVYAGCDHSFATCGTKFSNRINYGGFPFVPIYNLFEVGLD